MLMTFQINKNSEVFREHVRADRINKFSENIIMSPLNSVESVRSSVTKRYFAQRKDMSYMWDLDHHIKNKSLRQPEDNPNGGDYQQ
jgi:hypothetical protein